MCLVHGFAAVFDLEQSRLSALRLTSVANSIRRADWQSVGRGFSEKKRRGGALVSVADGTSDGALRSTSEGVALLNQRRSRLEVVCRDHRGHRKPSDSRLSD